MGDADFPEGYTRFSVETTSVVCVTHLTAPIRQALREGTLFHYAERHPQARALAGRGVVYAVPLPGDADRVVVRHNRHGGLLAPLTRDLFRAPTRAPRELRISERLREYGIATPPILGYAIYDAVAGFRRADVMTREIPNSVDLSSAFMSLDASYRAAAVVAAADLVLALSNAGAHHADLNVKNILLRRRDDGSLEALVLDVDCVTFDEPEIVFELNLARLQRSARKWQTRHGAPVTDTELDEPAGLVRERRTAPTRLSTSS